MRCSSMCEKEGSVLLLTSIRNAATSRNPKDAPTINSLKYREGVGGGHTAVSTSTSEYE
jgi:hypothetical protein